MSVAALLLALALLVGDPRALVRHRAGLLPPPAPSRGPAASRDPFAVASALDVLAVCLAGGMSVSAAAAASAPSAPAVLRRPLQRAADLLALGADPEVAWSDADPATDSPVDDTCESLLRLARRSASSGSALAHGVAELAERSRHEATQAAVAAGERAGVLIAGPLGLCFLPAFVCLGIVPVVAGLASEVFGGGLL